MDPTVDERIQLHKPMVGWWILDLLISTDNSHVAVSEIFHKMQIMDDHLELSRDPLMIVVDAYLEMCLSTVKGILMKEILKRQCW